MHQVYFPFSKVPILFQSNMPELQLYDFYSLKTTMSKNRKISSELTIAISWWSPICHVRLICDKTRDHRMIVFKPLNANYITSGVAFLAITFKIDCVR